MTEEIARGLEACMRGEGDELSDELKEKLRAYWQAQHEEWQDAQDHLLGLANSISLWLDWQFRGVPDSMLNAALWIAASHRSNVNSLEQSEQEKNRRILRMIKDVALTAAEPQGHG